MAEMMIDAMTEDERREYDAYLSELDGLNELVDWLGAEDDDLTVAEYSHQFGTRIVCSNSILED